VDKRSSNWLFRIPVPLGRGVCQQACNFAAIYHLETAKLNVKPGLKENREADVGNGKSNLQRKNKTKKNNNSRGRAVRDFKRT
jgi:hypothetical protein